jgi:Tfp pilus assembly protein FimT
MGFANAVAHQQRPLPLSVPGNAGLVQASVVLDSITTTNYVPPLDTATKWLNDTSLTSNAKRAIVFLSDGEPSDGNQFTTWLNGHTSIPVYTIALGEATVPFTRMVDLSARTGGQFYRVDPNNIARMDSVMTEIIKAVTAPGVPRSIEVTNTTFAPPMISRSVRMDRNADSSISPVMDSILALKTGLNSLTVKITMSDNDIRNFAIKIQADGPAATATTQSLICYPQPSLVLLNQAGGVDSAYTRPRRTTCA